MCTLLSTKYLILDCPETNQYSSWSTPFQYIFFVVKSGKPSAISKRICLPNTPYDLAPVPSSIFSYPCSKISLKRSRYCVSGCLFIAFFLVGHTRGCCFCCTS